MKKDLKVFIGALSFCCVAVVSSACHSENIDHALPVAQNDPLVDTIKKLADYQNFRKTTSDFDMFLTGICKKEKEIKDKFGVISKYSCVPQSGIETIRIDSREGQGQIYVMTLSVSFKLPKFEGVRRAVEHKLGKESKKTKDLSAWKYTADKGLNALGNPMISVSRDPDTSSASFDLALEQGP